MTLLNRLVTAVKKLSLLLRLNSFLSRSTWRLAAALRSSSPSISSRNRRSVSFNHRPGLQAWEDLDMAADRQSDGSDYAIVSPTQMRRTMSSPMEEGVDKEAERFITNFYRQLQLERQISMELRYCRRRSFESNSPTMSSISPSSVSSVSPTTAA